MMPINHIMAEVVQKTADAIGGHISFIFGDWEYIANTLMQWSAVPETAVLKYPCVCLYSPIDETRSREGRSSADIELMIVCQSLPQYTNEERDAITFEQVLRPVWKELMRQIEKHKAISRPYNSEYTYTEDFRFGRLALKANTDAKFRDYVDAVIISNFSLTFKNICTNG